MSTTTMENHGATPKPLQPAWRVMARKELRENAKWATAGLIALALGLCYQIYNINPQFANAYTLNDFWMRLNSAMMFGAPALAAVLGLLMILPEQRRDLWAFLTHRPAHRGSLFWGKVAAGLLLYAVMTLIPFLAAVLWAATPGNLPGPFAPGLALGGVGAILAGVPFLFAGMLTALRPARWYGSRAVPLAAAILAAAPLDAGMFASIVPPAALTALLCVPFALAARAAYVTAGHFDRPSAGGSSALGIVLWTGSAVTLTAICGLVYSFLQPLLSRPLPRSTYSTYKLLDDGELVIATTRDGFGEETLTPVRGAAGKPASAIHDRSATIGPAILSSSGAMRDADVPAYNHPDACVDSQESTWGINSMAWYFVSSEGRFERYDVSSRRLTAVAGPAGVFAPKDADQAGRFEERPSSISLLRTGEPFFVSGDSMYMLDEVHGALRRIALPFPAAEVQGAAALTGDERYAHDNNPGVVGYGAPSVLVATARQLTVLSRAGDTLFTISREFDARSYPNVLAQSAIGTGNVYIWYRPFRSGDQQVSIWDAHGRHIAAYTLPKLPDPVVADDGPPAYMLLMPPSVPAAMLAWAEAAQDRSYMARNFQESFFQSGGRLAVILSAISGLICALLGVIIARRRQQSPMAQAAWAFGMFWLGVPGILMMLSLGALPLLVTCPNCGRPRDVACEHCPRCHAPFPDPPTDGTEIFGDGAPYAGASAPIAAAT